MTVQVDRARVLVLLSGDTQCPHPILASASVSLALACHAHVLSKKGACCLLNDLEPESWKAAMPRCCSLQKMHHAPIKLCACQVLLHDPMPVAPHSACCIMRSHGSACKVRGEADPASASPARFERTTAKGQQSWAGLGSDSCAASIW